MHLAYWTNKATYTHTHTHTHTYTILIVFPRQQWFYVRASMLCYRYTAGIDVNSNSAVQINLTTYSDSPN